MPATDTAKAHDDALARRDLHAALGVSSPPAEFRQLNSAKTQ
jgi:hypothetical protein